MSLNIVESMNNRFKKVRQQDKAKIVMFEKLKLGDWHNIIFAVSTAIKQAEGGIANEEKDYLKQSMINYRLSLENTLAKVKLICLKLK
jgi:hypothetical protein